MVLLAASYSFVVVEHFEIEVEEEEGVNLR